MESRTRTMICFISRVRNCKYFSSIKQGIPLLTHECCGHKRVAQGLPHRGAGRMQLAQGRAYE
jgi:hypothetical protein